MSEPTTVYRAFLQTAGRFPDKPFIAVLPETASVYGIAPGEITYSAMADEMVPRPRSPPIVRQVLARVTVLAFSWKTARSFFRHWFALNALGVSVVPINPDLRLAELDYMIGHSQMCVAVVLDSRRADIVAAAQLAGRTLVVVGPDEALPVLGPVKPDVLLDENTECALLYTSGTTGRPKGCVLTNTYFINSGIWYRDRGGHIAMERGKERMLTPLPLFHMNAMATSTMAMVMVGGCLCVLDRFHPKSWWDSVREFRATIVHYLGVMPPMLMGAAPSPADKAHQVRFGFGAGVDRRLHEAFETRFGFPLIEAWAMTETGGGVVIVANHDPRHRGTQCFGMPGPEAEVKVVLDDGSTAPPDQPGELLVRRAGPDPKHGFFREYLKDPQATNEAWTGGWFHTGDIVRQDADGYLYFVDRKKNVIRRSGENISAVEVESVLLQHPAIANVAVAATPDAVRGDEVFACIIARAEAPADRAALARDIVSFCLTRLAYYKAPGYIAFVDSLPLTSTQKVQRGALKDMVASLAASPDTFNTCDMKKRTA